jgi:epoxyqueuosine reductase
LARTPRGLTLPVRCTILRRVRVTGLTRRIKEQARALGFDLVGVAPLAPSAYGTFYERWLARGYAGEMAYLARPDAVAKRRDPRLVLPEARSVVVVALNYFQGTAPPAASAGGRRGRVARYAWGDDYHDLMWARLEGLAAFVEAQVGQPVAHRRYVDTGPLLERELAARAGLGWIGKNTMLINPRRGSWLFLGELLLALDLEYDPPFTVDHCGSCTRCIEACPTGCILPERTLDASRCISYLTIELKSGKMPPPLRPLVGRWVFGCDVCQEVCPWNRFARPTGEAAFRPRPSLPEPDMEELLALDDEAFRRRFHGSPILRAGRRGLQRNAAVALGNIAEDRGDKNRDRT